MSLTRSQRSTQDTPCAQATGCCTQAVGCTGISSTVCTTLTGCVHVGSTVCWISTGCWTGCTVCTGQVCCGTDGFCPNAISPMPAKAVTTKLVMAFLICLFITSSMFRVQVNYQGLRRVDVSGRVASQLRQRACHRPSYHRLTIALSSGGYGCNGGAKIRLRVASSNRYLRALI